MTPAAPGLWDFAAEPPRPSTRLIRVALPEGQPYHTGDHIAVYARNRPELVERVDELTRTRKVRRGFIAQKYAVLVDALYGGRTEQFVETQVKFEDGRTGTVSATLGVVEAKRFGATTAVAGVAA